MHKLLEIDLNYLKSISY